MVRVTRCIGLSIALWSGLALLPAPAPAGQTLLVSAGLAGAPADGGSNHPGASADGRYVAFDSSAANLVPGDANGRGDVFVRDLLTGAVVLASVGSDGSQGDGHSYDAVISADGRFVAFTSEASNLVAGDLNGASDIFLRDLAAGTTVRVSVDAAGGEGNGPSLWPSVSADGRSVAFESAATNLVPGDANGADDVFVRDLAEGSTLRVSVDSAGGEADGPSHWASISADGLEVAFDSLAANLVAGDDNGASDVFVRDAVSGATMCVSVGPGGAQGDNGSSSPALSADGGHVAFWSTAGNLVSGDTNDAVDVFVHDRSAGATERVSVGGGGGEGDAGSWYPAISADGRHVAFWSQATNLAAGDDNGAADVFVRDRQAGSTVRASVDSLDAPGNGDCYSPAISADGRFVAFSSAADNLVPGDTNGFGDVFLRDLLFQGGTGAAADIEVVAASAPAEAARGTNARYVYTVVNHGPAAADEVTLVDVVSRGKLFKSPPVRGRSRIAVHRLGLLPAGASASVTVVIDVTGRQIVQTLTAGAVQPDDSPGNNRLVVATPVVR